MQKPFIRLTLLAALIACVSTSQSMADPVGDGAATSTASSAAQPELWQSDLPSALEAAKNTNKNLFVDLSASWCPHCRHLENSILPNRKVTDFLTNGFIGVKIDADSRLGKKIQSGYGMSGVPDLLVFDSSGTLKGKLAGAPNNASGFIQLVGELAAKSPDSSMPTIDTFAKSNEHKRHHKGD